MDEEVIVAAAVGGCVGLVFGLIILAFGMGKGKHGLAIGGFFVCLVAGGMLGFLGALPAFLIFLFSITSSKSER